MIDELRERARALTTGIFRSPTSDPTKACKQCHDQRGVEIEMQATTTWSPTLCAHVDVWACPECGREVLRAEGEEVGLTAPDGERF